MKRLNVSQIATGAQGKLILGDSSLSVSSVVRDSREAAQDCLFVAIKGENNDGHNFLSKAYQQGCRAFMICEGERVTQIPTDAAVILVEDTLRGIQHLAAYYIQQFNIIKIGVTGSTGKTSTKELLYAVFSQKYRTIRNQGNFNNHLGVPLTAFQIDDATEAAIFEMGMNNPGEIELLADIVRPDAAVITNIGISHLGNLGSRENILKAKLEITTYMNTENLLIYNADNDMLRQLGQLPCRQLRVGTGETEDMVLSGIKDFGEEGISFSIAYEGKSTVFNLHAPGAHNAWNAALAAACGAAFGISLEEASAGLENFRQEGKRLDIKDANGIKVIDDTYNASPDSVKAAIDVLMGVKGKRKIAVLADMFELGEDSGHFHAEIGKYAAVSGTDILISIGSDAKFITEGATGVIPAQNLMHFNDKETLNRSLEKLLRDGDVILLKGSRGMKMDETVKMIMEMRK